SPNRAPRSRSFVQVTSVQLRLQGGRFLMCGICGIVDFSGSEADDQTLARMTMSLRHRGPDDTGILVSPPAGLGHTRLSIIDLSVQGHQPMISDDGTLAIVYNGEIYNFPELKRDLESQCVSFRARSDTAPTLQAFHTWRRR